jgi:uncharacterized protein (TIGR03086 family)
MDTRELFLASDAALRSVVDRIDPADLGRPAPQEWTELPDPTVRDILGRHAYDEAWVPGLIEGRSIAEGDEFRDADLLGDDPVASYDRLNERATDAVTAGVAPDAVFRFQYGDYPAEEGFAHLATYRAFQAWAIAEHLGIPFHLSPELVDGFTEHVVPHADEWRQWGVFGPAIEPPAGADAETRLLCTLGFWKDRAPRP